MIKLKQIFVEGGKVKLLFEYTEGEKVKQVWLDKDVIDERVYRVVRLLGVKPTREMLRRVIVQTIRELRRRRFAEIVYDYAELIDVDLEKDVEPEPIPEPVKPIRLRRGTR